MDGPGRYEPESIPSIKHSKDLPKPKFIPVLSEIIKEI